MATKKAALACSVCGSRNYTKSVSEGKKANASKLINSVNIATNIRCIGKQNNIYLPSGRVTDEIFEKRHRGNEKRDMANQERIA